MSKTNSEGLERLKSVLDANPKLLNWVIPDERAIFIDDEEQNPICYFFDEKEFEVAQKLIAKETRTRPNPKDRFNPWETLGPNDEVVIGKKEKLLAARKIYKKNNSKQVNKRALKELCDKYGIPKGMEKLFLNELKLSTSRYDEPAKNHAKLLGLL
jgi:hypothetical protein